MPARMKRRLKPDEMYPAGVPGVRVSWLTHTLGPRLAELDVNPLLVRADGVVALDARATINRSL